MNYRQCLKCKKFSGDDWSQCKGYCPVEGSPDFQASAVEQYGAPVEMSREEMCIEVRGLRAREIAEDGEIPF